MTRWTGTYPRGSRATPKGPAAPVSHWSEPPQHAGYRSGQTSHGDGWPERGGAGPQTGPHIPNLAPRDREHPEPQSWGTDRGVRAMPRSPFTEERQVQRPRRGRRPDRFRPSETGRR